MDNTNCYFPLMHGAGLGGWIWDQLIPELDVPAEVIDLPGRGNWITSRVEGSSVESQRTGHLSILARPRELAASLNRILRQLEI